MTKRISNFPSHLIFYLVNFKQARCIWMKIKEIFVALFVQEDFFNHNN